MGQMNVMAMLQRIHGDAITARTRCAQKEQDASRNPRPDWNYFGGGGGNRTRVLSR